MNNARPDYSNMTMSEREVWAVLGLIHGKANAISHKDLAHKTNKPERKVRSIVVSLIIKHRLVICSSYDRENGGYYLPETGDEVQETCKKLHGHALGILFRESVIKKISLAELLKQYQKEIPFSD